MRLFGKLQPVPVLAGGERMTFSSKLDRLAGRLKQPEWRRYGKLLVAGKLLGIAAVFAIMLAIQIAPNILGGATAVAQQAAPAAPAAAPADPLAAVKASDIVNPVNTLWV